MKFRVCMKCPDVLNQAIWDAMKLDLANITDEEEKDLLFDHRFAKVNKMCGRWFEYDDYLVVEVDTEAETCVVLPN